MQILNSQMYMYMESPVSYSTSHCSDCCQMCIYTVSFKKGHVSFLHQANQWQPVCVCNHLKVSVTMSATKEYGLCTAWPSIKPRQLKPSRSQGNRHGTAVERSNMAPVALSKQRLRERLRRLALGEGNRLCKWPWPPTKESQWSSSMLTGAES